MFPNQRRYLLLGLCASLAVHAGALAWRFGPAKPRPAAPPELEIVLVNAASATAPEQAHALAQQQLDGGGDALQGVASSPLPRTSESAQTLVLAAMRKRQAQLEAEQLRLLTQLQADARAAAPRDAVVSAQPQNPGQNTEDQTGLIQNAQIAALSQRVQAYNAKPRRSFVGPSAQASHYAAYLDAWARRIETIGTAHYPDEARGHIYGSLRMTITVRADGSLADFNIDQPSPHAVLNQAARRIVQMAAPFPPLPPEIRQDTDELVITRTWNFMNDKLNTSTQ